jgi:hypothetical protein
MSIPSNPLPTKQDLERRVPVASAVRQRKNHQSNLWFFDSPKINRRFAISGDTNFMHVVLLEGDPQVVGYNPTPDPVYASIDGENQKTTLDIHVYYQDGHTEWWEFKRSQDSTPSRTGRSGPQLSAQAQAASAAGIAYRIRTDADLQNKEILFDNWLTLCAGINRCRNHSLHRESEVLTSRFHIQNKQTVQSLLDAPDIDPAYMLAVIGLSLQKGTLTANLAHSLFGVETVLSRVTT